MLISSEEEEEQEAKNSYKFQENNNRNMMSDTEEDWDDIYNDGNMVSRSDTKEDYDILESKPKAYASMQNKKNFSLWNFEEEDDEEAMQLAIQFSLSTNKVKDEKGKGVACPKVDFTFMYFSTWGSMRESGSTSTSGPTCGICDDVLPRLQVDRTVAPTCCHVFCNDCIREYIGQKIKEDIYQVECPVLIKCKIESQEKLIKCKAAWKTDFVWKHSPEEVRHTWYLARKEASVLQQTVKFLCPLEGCAMPNVDDEREYLIRACTWCWRLICCGCWSPWHMGMTCIEYHWAKLEKERREKALALKLEKEKQEKALGLKLEKEKQEKANNDFMQRLIDHLTEQRSRQTSEHEEREKDQADGDMPLLLILRRPPHRPPLPPVLTKKTPYYIVGLDGVTRILYFEIN